MIIIDSYVLFCVYYENISNQEEPRYYKDVSYDYTVYYVGLTRIHHVLHFIYITSESGVIF